MKRAGTTYSPTLPCPTTGTTWRAKRMFCNGMDERISCDKLNANIYFLGKKNQFSKKCSIFASKKVQE
jgi:hypothetical protein